MGLNLVDDLKPFTGSCSRVAGYPMSHRGEGSVYQDKPPSCQTDAGPPGSGPPKPSTGKVQSSQQSPSGASSEPVAAAGRQSLPQPKRHYLTLRLWSLQCHLHSPSTRKWHVGGLASGAQSEMAQKMADAKGTHAPWQLTRSSTN